MSCRNATSIGAPVCARKRARSASEAIPGIAVVGIPIQAMNCPGADSVGWSQSRSQPVIMPSCWFWVDSMSKASCRSSGSVVFPRSHTAICTAWVWCTVMSCRKPTSIAPGGRPVRRRGPLAEQQTAEGADEQQHQHGAHRDDRLRPRGAARPPATAVVVVEPVVVDLGRLRRRRHDELTDALTRSAHAAVAGASPGSSSAARSAGTAAGRTAAGSAGRSSPARGRHSSPRPRGRCSGCRAAR